MFRLVDKIQKYRWYIIVFVPIFVLILSSSLQKLSFEGSYRIWFGKDSKILQNYDNFRKVFGNDDSVVIVFKDKDGIFNKKALNSVARLTDILWKTKYITRVDSITSYQHIHTSVDDPDEIIVENFIKELHKADATYLKQKKDIALGDEQIVNSIISADGKTTMIAARLTAGAGENEDISFELMGIVDDIIKKESEITGYKYHISGGAAITTAFVSIAMADGEFFTPLVFVIVSLLLLVLFRKFSGVLIPIAVVALTVGVVLSIQVLLGYKLNNFTANIPVFIVAIGIADAVHIYIIWLMYRKEGLENKQAVTKTLEKNMLPVFLTSVTTSIGFASLAISEVVPVATLGIATASAAMLAFVLSVVYMPAILLTINKKIKQKHIADEENKMFDELYKKYAKFIIKYDKKVIAITTGIFAIFAVGLFKVQVDSNTMRYFDESVDVRQATEFIGKNLTGSMSYEIVVDSGEVDGIKNPKFLNKVQEFYIAYKKQFEDIRHIYSLLDVVKQFNKVMNGDKKKYYTVPSSKELVAQYLLLYSLSLPQGMEINDKMDIEQKLLRVTAKVNMVDTSHDLYMMKWAEKWWQDNNYNAVVNGQTAMFAHMQSSVTDTLIYSISIALVLVSLMMLMIFKRLKMMALFIFPNVLPIVLVLGIMGWLGINIDLGVAVAGAIILGVAVDDSIHFFVKYFDAVKLGHNMEQRFVYVFKYAGKAILFTTIILSAAFFMFVGSHFVPNFNFGIVTASALIIAFVADLFLLPSIISLLDKKGIDVK